MHRGRFDKGEVKCAFFEFFNQFPEQRVWAIDRGETEEEWEESAEFLWRQFVEILLDVVEDE